MQRCALLFLQPSLKSFYFTQQKVKQARFFSISTQLLHLFPLCSSPSSPALYTVLKPVGTNGINVIVDVCKTFRESALNWFRKAGVKNLHHVILTHSHTDAIGGLDDMRELQERDTSLPVHADKETGDTIKIRYPYLFPSTGPSEKNAGMYIGALNHILMENFVPFFIEDLEVVPIPLWHGSVTCLGFVFSQKDSDCQFVYFSDFRCKATPTAAEVGEVPSVKEQDFVNLTLFVNREKSLAILKRKKIAVMMLDAIFWTDKHISHSNKVETVRVIQELQKNGVDAEQFYFTGISCRVDHLKATQELMTELKSSKVLLAFDGLNWSL